jgi:hypothetical protein
MEIYGIRGCNGAYSDVDYFDVHRGE